MSMEALIARVEGASGPDRDSDMQVHLTIGKHLTIDKGGTPKPKDRYTGNPIPFYTASLDAAMTLVPEGWRMWSADFSIKGRFVWMLCGPKLTWIVHEDGAREGGNDWYQSGVACTPALALCAAALRARTSKETDDGE